MTERLLKFVTLDPAPPAKRASEERAEDYAEIYRAFEPVAAREQASRCSQCGVPFCQSGCPLQNNIPDWLQLAAEGRLEEAYELSAATNPMPEVCGRICPQDRLCEQACVIEKSTHGAVTIGAIEKYITDTAWTEGWVEPIRTGRDKGESVGIIGAGPAGLAAAERLREHGYGVTVYDRHDRVGGLLIYGIPHFKLEKEVVVRRAARLEEAGVMFKLGVDVDETVFAQMESEHTAVLIATGVYDARRLDLPDGGADGVVKAMDYLTASNRVQLGDDVAAFTSGALNASGKNVIVVGGGDTAMDCVRTAVRQGASSVTCLYRRDRANMPGSAREVRSAEEEGVTFEWLAQPKKILTQNNEVTGVSAVRMRLGPPDASGRQAPQEAPGSAFELPCDMLITALGFSPEDAPKVFGVDDLAVTRWGTVSAKPLNNLMEEGAGQTTRPNVFAAGDIVRGASLVVWALRDGRAAADDIHVWRTREGAKATSEQAAVAAE